MTRSKEGGICPVCGRCYAMLATHLRGFHKVANLAERAILNNWATGRVYIPPGPCPMPGCRRLILHVAKHLQGHRDISTRRKEEELAALKRAVSLAALAKLRASNPHPPMATSLDLEDPREDPRHDPGQGSSTSQRPSCSNPRCRKYCERAEKTIKRLQRRNAALKAEQPSSSEDDEKPQLSGKRRLQSAEDPIAESPRKKVAKEKHLAPKEESEEDPKLGKLARRVHRAMAPYFMGKSRASKIRGIVLGASLDAYVEEYGQFIFCPEGTTKMQENAVSKISRAKVFLKFLTYPAVLRKAGLAPTTIILYVGQAISFVEYFRATPPKHSRITGGQTVVVIRELRKLLKDLNRTVLGHQALIKQAKGKRLVAREDLATCQALARAKIPSLLHNAPPPPPPSLFHDIEKAAPRDPKTRYRFFGYFAAYLSAIYGHRTGVLTRMRVKEVREAIGDDQTGYLINVMEHKTVRKFGTAQIYLNAEEYGWCRTWIRLRARTVPTNGLFFSSLGRGEAKDMARYFRGAWAEMGLKEAPSIMDLRTAVSTFNFESSHAEVRQNLARFMCHSEDTREVLLAPPEPEEGEEHP
ncbi:hypothetical protein D9C73_000111 [Collichthys lucidus]|uniref:Uncharacterized protein n=1 Tax=Collichthys lucidus TaxID=240159 RepID=A0A4U5U001_COLLU|nr:hypothetical protein D9C73_000111 [Collichthys lucidus]